MIESAVRPANRTIGPAADARYHVVMNAFHHCDWSSIFNTTEFFGLHNNGSGMFFHLGLGEPFETVGVVHFTEIEPGIFRSPARGTFGGYEFNRPLRLEVIEQFVDEVESTLRERAARRIELSSPPDYFDPSHSAVLSNVLQRRGYVPEIPELAYLLRVDTEPLWDKLRASRRQRIHRCQKRGITARRLGADSAKDVYDVIQQNRNAKGFPMTMSFDAIREMIRVFSERLVFFGAFEGDLLIASSICVKVSDAVLYVFYWGDLPRHERFSSVTLLAQCIYEYAQSGGFKLLDCGTATRNGEPIYGLVSFKREIGCFPSAKPTYVKNLA